jgi:dihydroorotate dehydrogenase (NAD+) catalytic subunit
MESGMIRTPFTVDVAGLRLPNPLILASGIADETGLSMANAILNGAGGVVTKSLSLNPREGHGNPVIIQLPFGLINAMGLPNPGIEEYRSEVHDFKVHTGGEHPIIGSVFGSTVEEYAECAAAAEGIGVDAIEINGSCPNAKGLGTEFGQDPSVIEDLVKAVKANVTIPVFFKLTPMCADISRLAKACELGGADGIVAINTMKAMGIDIRTGRPILTNRTGGLSGPAIRPIGVRCVYEIAQSVGVPVIGVGGISTWEDAIEYIMAGASAVQIGSAVAWGGLSVFGTILSGIASFMEEEGYSRIEEMRGLAREVDAWRS